MERVLGSAGRAADPKLQFPFYYPPIFLLELKPLGALPYAPAAVVWLAVTGAAYLVAARVAGGRALAVVVALAAPAAFACVYVGQNGLLTAALAGLGLAWIPKRPLVAGVLIGLIAYKPQFGPALPVLLLAGSRFRVIASAGLTVCLTYALAGAALGWPVYTAWISALAPGGHGVAALGGLPPTKLQSLYGLARTLNAAPLLAWAVQAGVALVAVALAARLWRKQSAWPLQAAAAGAVMLIVSPYSVLYDYPLLSIAMAFLIADAGRAPVTRLQAITLALAFGAPFASAALALPLCPVGAVAALGVAIARAERRITKRSPCAPHPGEAPAVS